LPRIIPTCVGKRGVLRLLFTSTTDHPHVRGEKRGTTVIVHINDGSSPRAWGKVHPNRIFEPVSRIIPTCVGKRVMRRDADTPRSDHPHVRGEKVLISFCFMVFSGSSPRAWGKDFVDSLFQCFVRIIPTCVGKRRQTTAAPHC